MKLITTLTLLVAVHLNAFATWSIILIDSKTREIGIAGASCTHNCYGIGGIIPGKGAIIVQAMSNKEAKAKGLEMIMMDFSPEQIIAALRNPVFDPERQQYAVVTLNYLNSPAVYTGVSTNPHKGYGGALTASGVSVQGNTLANEGGLQAILNAVVKGQKDSLRIDEILMLALEAGSAAGGDKRCGAQTASTAFVTVAKPHDKPRKPYLNLIIFGQEKSGMNAVAMLRNKYEKWKSRR